MNDAILQDLRSRFEGQQAIYLESRVLLVRVSNIKADGATGSKYITASIEEILTPGLPVSLGGLPRRHQWTIGAVEECMNVTDTVWSAPDIGWYIFFSPDVVQRVVKLASQFSVDMSDRERFKKVVESLAEKPQYH